MTVVPSSLWVGGGRPQVAVDAVGAADDVQRAVRAGQREAGVGGDRLGVDRRGQRVPIGVLVTRQRTARSLCARARRRKIGRVGVGRQVDVERHLRPAAQFGGHAADEPVAHVNAASTPMMMPRPRVLMAGCCAQV